MNNTKMNRETFWLKTLSEYYWRPEWELYDLKEDPEELINVVNKKKYKTILNSLRKKLYNWMTNTKDPWLCSPHAVLEDKGNYKNNMQCLSLFNDFY